MLGMFNEASSFNGDIGNWNVSNVSVMGAMFLKASSFNQDLDNWPVSNVENMHSMFKYASSFNQDLSAWDVTNVTLCGQFDNNATNWTLPKPNFTQCTP